MKLTYVYRIYPSTEQVAIMETHLELLRRHWNYSLGQRLDWLRRTRCKVDGCSLISEPIGEIPGEFPNYNLQSSLLKQTKELFEEYKGIYHDVQQQNLKRLEKAWDTWINPDSKGNRGGRPRFKKAGCLRSFTFPRVNCAKAGANIKDDVLTLSKIGSMPINLHREFPEGFTAKICTIVRKADGWYVCISLADETVPNLIPLDEIKNPCGVDVGLKEFLTTSIGGSVPLQQNYRRSQHKLARHQKFATKGVKGSKNSAKRQNRIARIHQKVARQCREFHYKTAHQLVKEFDLIAVENLNIKGLAKSKLAKSILDAAWASFLVILEAVAVKRGIRVIKVKPYGTSIDCSNCGWKVPKNLSIRVHNCPNCLISLDRDLNASINILNRALSEKLPGGFPPKQTFKDKDVGLTFSACGGQLNWTARTNDRSVKPNETGNSQSDLRSLPHSA